MGLSLSIVIPVFNHPCYTKACLDSLLAPSAVSPEIIVVDNGSLGKTQRLLASYGDKIKVIRNDSNVGMAKAMNQGARIASSDWLILMHNDCVVGKGWANHLQAAASEMSSSRFRIACPMSNYVTEGSFCDKLLQAEFLKYKPTNKSNPSYEEIMDVVAKTYSTRGGLDSYSTSVAKVKNGTVLQSVDEISTFFMLIRKSTLDEIGWLSEEFHLRGMEEQELHMRAQRLGFVAARLGASFVHHFGNITTDGFGFDHGRLRAHNFSIMSEIRTRAISMMPTSWTAVIFPDKDPELTARLERSIQTTMPRPDAVIRLPPPGIFPESAAWKWVLPQVRTEFLMHLDGDLILDTHAPSILLSEFTSPNIGMACADARDFTRGQAGYIKMWRKSALESTVNAGLPDDMPDIAASKSTERHGWDIKVAPCTIGEHGLRMDPWTVFASFYRNGLKTRNRGAAGGPRATWDIHGAQGSGVWGHVSLLGFHCGIQTSAYKGDVHNIQFDEEAWRAYLPVRDFCEAISAVDPFYHVLRIGGMGRPRDKIRVLVCLSTMMLGGFEKCIVGLITGLDKSKFEIVMMVERDMHPFFSKELDDAGIRRVILYKGDIPDDVDREVDWRRAMEIVRPDVIIGGLKGAFYTPARLMGIPFIERMAGWSGMYAWKNSLYPAKDWCQAIVCQYEGFRKELLADPRWRADPEKTVVIPTGLDPAAYNAKPMAEARARFGIRKDATVIGMAARCNAVKNIPLAVDTLAILVASGMDAELRVVGQCSEPAEIEEKNKILARAAELGISNRVFVMDPIPPEDIVWFMSAADVMLLTSITEGTPACLIEAQFVGRPIVATDVGGIREAIGDKAFYAADATGLAAAIKKAVPLGSVSYDVEHRGIGEYALKWSQVIEKAYLSKNKCLPYGSSHKTKIGVMTGSILVEASVAKALDRALDTNSYELFVYSNIEGEHIGNGTRVIRGPQVYRSEVLGKLMVEDGIDVLIVPDDDGCKQDLAGATHKPHAVLRAGIHVSQDMFDSPFFFANEWVSILEEQAKQVKADREASPLTTIIIPVRDRSKFIGRAIDSVLAQTAKNWRMIVVSDGAIDPAVAKEVEARPDPRISFMEAPKGNQNSAINVAIRAAKTSHSTRLDDDDTLEPNAIERITEEFSKNPDVTYMYGSYRLIDEDDNVCGPVHEAEDFSPQRMEEWFIAIRPLLWKNRDVLLWGGLPEGMERCGDYLFALTAMLRGAKFLAIKEPLTTWRQGPYDRISVGYTKTEERAFIATLRERYLDMKRLFGISWGGEDPDVMLPRSWKVKASTAPRPLVHVVPQNNAMPVESTPRSNVVVPPQKHDAMATMLAMPEISRRNSFFLEWLMATSSPTTDVLVAMAAAISEGPDVQDAALKSLRFHYRAHKEVLGAKADLVRSTYLELAMRVPGRGQVTRAADAIDHGDHETALSLALEWDDLLEDRWKDSMLFQGIRAAFFSPSAARQGAIFAATLIKRLRGGGLQKVIEVDIQRKLLLVSELVVLFELLEAGWKPLQSVDKRLLKAIESQFEMQW